MTTYILAYSTAKSTGDKDKDMALFGKFKAWMEGLGTAIVSPANPMMGNRTVSKDGVSDGGSLSGYTLVEAADMAAALAMAKSCPHLEIGTIEVAEIKSMKMD